jgi:hypothetical protein
VAAKLQYLLAIAAKSGIIKIIKYGVLQDYNEEPLLVFMYVNDIDTDISNAVGIKLTTFAYETVI